MDKNITIEKVCTCFKKVLKMFAVMGINNEIAVVQEIDFEETFHFSKTILTEYKHIIQQ